MIDWTAEVLLATATQIVIGVTFVAVCFALGWVARGERDRQRRISAVRRARAVREARTAKAKPGTKPARVSRASLDRGKVVQPEDL